MIQGSYRDYCEARFSKLMGRPAIFDEENEEYALMRCYDIWKRRYPLESFENEGDLDSLVVGSEDELFKGVAKCRMLLSMFEECYRSEVVYLIAARQRYKAFLHLVLRYADGSCRLVPTSDILLMWLTHQVC